MKADAGKSSAHDGVVLMIVVRHSLSCEYSILSSGRGRSDRACLCRVATAAALATDDRYAAWEDAAADVTPKPPSLNGALSCSMMVSL